MGRLQEDILAVLTAELEARTAWDEPPGLYLLYVESGKPRLSQLALPDEIWSLDRPPAVLDSLSRQAIPVWKAIMPIVPASLFGAAWRYEGWEIQTPEDATAMQWRRDEQDARRHRISQRGDRVEIRSLEAVDRGGVQYTASVSRDGRPCHPDSVMFPRPGGAVHTGTMSEALDRIVRGLLGVGIPERVPPPGFTARRNTEAGS